ncbi:MAG TPA: ATP-binding protein [Pyrinomonadaceae bacterium]
MGLENFIRDALHQPHDYVAYHVGRELAELHPEKVIIEGQTFYFDLDAFVRAGQCSVVEQKSVFHHVRAEWEGVGKKLEQSTENSWLHVIWKGQLLDVVLISWAESCYRRRHHWIIADERKIGEEFFQTVCDWSAEVRAEILVFHDGYFQKDKQLFKSIKSATFDNLILTESLKQQIENDFQQFFNSRDVYERYGIPWKRGAIFIGPPGNGKTHTLKALINQLSKPCLYVRSFKSDDDTEQRNMAEVFARARMTTGCLLVLEDLDSMIDDANRSFLLNELDGFQSNTGVVVLATTNHPEKLDSSILDRPSRFDRKYYFQLPAEPQRHAYVERWNETVQPEMRVSDRGTAALVGATEGFSFAYLKELFVASMVQWVSLGGTGSMDDVILPQADLLRAQMKSGDKEGQKVKTKSVLLLRAISGSLRR